jgi:hypothetical protein
MDLTFQTVDDAETRIAALCNMYAEHKLTLQPLVYSISGSGRSTVVLNNYRWTFETTIKAMDMCFKLIQVPVLLV